MLVMGLVTSSMAEEVSKPSEKRDDVVKNRLERQEKRIEEGVKTGTINPEEAKKLEEQQNRIEKIEKKAMSDGKMTQKEFHKIEKIQNAASKNIKVKKHNQK